MDKNQRLMSIANFIKNRRKELGITQEELAELTGYTNRSSITKIENGKVDLSQSKIIKFAEALKIDPIKIINAGVPKNIVRKKQMYDFKLPNGEAGNIKIKDGKIHVAVGIPENPESFKEIDFNDEKNFKLKNALQLLELSIKDIKITSKTITDLEKAIANIFSENYNLDKSETIENFNYQLQEVSDKKFAFEGDSSLKKEDKKLEEYKKKIRKGNKK